MSSETMSVWGMIGQKGGSGKTTIGVQLLTLALKRELNATILDLDRQQSAVQWYGQRFEKIGDDPLAAASGPPEALSRLLEKAGEVDTDLAIVDTSPAIDQSMISTARYSDVLIVPTRVDLMDRLSLIQTLEAIDSLNATSKTVVVLNQVSKEAVAEQAETRKIAAETGVRVLKASLLSNPDYPASVETGLGAAGFRSNRNSYRDLVAVYDEIVKFEESLKPRRGRR